MSLKEKLLSIHWKKVATVFAGAIGIPAFVAFSLVHLDRTGFFNISQIEIVIEGFEGQSTYLKPRIEEVDQALEQFRGQSLWRAKITEASKVLKNHQWIEFYQISRSWPSTLVLHVKPYEVKMIYLSSSGKLIPVIKNGKLLDVVESPVAPDVPILSGASFGAKVALREKAVQVLDEIPSEGSFSRKTISELTYDAREGFLATLVKTGARVKLGEEMIAQKSKRVASVLDYLESRQMQPSTIDANLSRKVHVQCDRPQCGSVRR